MNGRAARLFGAAWTVLAVGLVFVLQWVNDDWFPPEISLSQFGLGPNGWVLSLFLSSTAVASLAWYRVGPRDRITLTLLGIGALGAFVASLIPTQAGGLQESWNAVVHMIGSVMMVSALPLGLCRMAWVRPRPWRVVAVLLTVLSAVSLLLLLLAAFGLDTAGIGPQRSWAWWQAVSASTQLALLVWIALARGLPSGVRGATSGRRRETDLTGS